MMRRVVCAVLGLTWSGAAHAQATEAVALVLEISGIATPTVAAYGELRAGQKVSLAADARLRFVHYKSCRMVRVRGGEVTFLPSGHLFRDGETESDEIRTCPKRLAGGAKSGTAGGLVMRGGGPNTLQLPAQPALMIVGARTSSFSRVYLQGAAGPRIALERVGSEPLWRYAGPLLPAGSYALVAAARDGTTLVNETVAVTGESRSPEIAILRVD